MQNKPTVHILVKREATDKEAAELMGKIRAMPEMGEGVALYTSYFMDLRMIVISRCPVDSEVLKRLPNVHRVDVTRQNGLASTAQP